MLNGHLMLLCRNFSLSANGKAVSLPLDLFNEAMNWPNRAGVNARAKTNRIMAKSFIGNCSS